MRVLSNQLFHNVAPMGARLMCTSGGQARTTAQKIAEAGLAGFLGFSIGYCIATRQWRTLLLEQSTLLLQQKEVYTDHIRKLGEIYNHPKK